MLDFARCVSGDVEFHKKTNESELRSGGHLAGVRDNPNMKGPEHQAIEGMEITVQASGERARFLHGEWTIGVVDVSSVRVNGQQVLAARQPAISYPTGGSVIDEQARSALSQIVAALRAHGLISATE